MIETVCFLCGISDGVQDFLFYKKVSDKVGIEIACFLCAALDACEDYQFDKNCVGICYTQKAFLPCVFLDGF